MTNTEHPITPPPELVELWADEQSFPTFEEIAARAAQWGADQELKASCDAIYEHEGQPLSGGTAEWLRAARRPKPPSLKEQALDDLAGLMSELDGAGNYSNCADRIRHALQQLPD
jgi:hypothetical protein